MKKSKKQVEITTDNIEEILKNKGAMGIIDPLWWRVDIYQDYETYQNDLAKFTPEQRRVFAMEWYFVEVCNGGHCQFLTNSTGIVWKEALEGFEMINFTAGVEIFQRLKALFGGHIPFDRSEREDYVDNLSEEDLDIFDEMDNLLYENDGVYLESVEKFILNHKDKFTFIGEIEIFE